MNYPLSYWKKGDLVVLESSIAAHYHFRNHIFIYMQPHPPPVLVNMLGDTPFVEPSAVLYCINDGTTVYMRARYLREPKEEQ